MKQSFIVLLMAALAAGAAFNTSASVVQTFGTGSAVQQARYSADFELNTDLSNDYVEGGLLFSFNGTGDNAGCGFAGVHCVEPGELYSAAFGGNYMATDGMNAYLSIRSLQRDLTAIELAVDSGYNNIHGFWQAFRDQDLVGSGHFSLGAGGSGGVLGLKAQAGFDELRYFAFSSAGRSSGFSAPAIDSVRAFAVPEPSSALLSLAGLLGLAGLTRRRRPR